MNVYWVTQDLWNGQVYAFTSEGLCNYISTFQFMTECVKNWAV